MLDKKSESHWEKFMVRQNFIHKFEMLQSRFPNLKLTDSAKELYEEFLFVNHDMNILGKAIDSAFINCDTFPSPKQLDQIAQELSSNISEFQDYQGDTQEAEND